MKLRTKEIKIRLKASIDYLLGRDRLRLGAEVLTGLDKEQYNICWIQHTDKNRLELNFFILNVELSTEKRLQPYYDKADRIMNYY